MYFKYNRCLAMKGRPLKGIFKEMIDLIDSGKVDKLVVNIRDNRGGSSPLLDPFIDEVTERDINNSNRLFVIVGRATYSSAILNVLHFKNETNATFLGEPTEGKPNHYGEVKSFKLPNTGMWVTYSTKYFTFIKGDPITFMPDRIIEVALQDYMDGKDPVLDALIKDY
ncbi:MAG: hypothetical protein ACM3TR_11065 [Caulobacteraceae bacterium]